MLTPASVVVERNDDEEDRFAAQDYAWMVRLKVIVHTSVGWAVFRAGYAAGGEIGRNYVRRRFRLVGSMDEMRCRCRRCVARARRKKPVS
jgi:hypothetical protein